MLERTRDLLVAAALASVACTANDAPATAGGGTSSSGGDETGLAPICVAGERLCGEAEVLVCADDGTEWLTEPCADGQLCLDGMCQAEALMVTTEVLEPGALSFDYDQTLAATGGAPPYAWSVGSGQVPPGLSVDATGAVTGVPTATGDYVFEAQVEDAEGTTASRDFSITVHSEPLTIITLPELGAFDEGMPMNVPLLALGGTEPYGWFLVDGALPDGVIVDAAGAVTGMPLQPGPFDFRIRVVDAQRPPGWDEQDFSFQVDLRPLTVVGTQEYDLLAFKVVVLPLLAVIPGIAVPYVAQLEADGGLTPYSWSEEPMPAGLDVFIPQSGIPADLVLDSSGEITGSVTNTDEVVTVPLIGVGIDLTGFFFYAEVSDSQDPAARAGALFVIPTVPVG
ncbi:MAG: Ig domain-containing protein [Myxococcota bacterium]